MDDELMRAFRLLVLSILPLLLAACGSAWWLERASYPEDRALARSAIGDLIAGNRIAFARKLPPQIRPQLATQFTPMRQALPLDRVPAIVLVDAGWTSVATVQQGSYRTARLAYEIVGGEKRALVQMVIRRQGGGAMLIAFNVSRIDRPARDVNGFRLGDGSLGNFLVALMALAGLVITILAVRRVWTSGLFQRRWLWITGCLVGLIRITTVWGTGQTFFAPFYITLFSAGAVRQGLGPWTIAAGIPVVAIWALLRHRALKDRAGGG